MDKEQVEDPPPGTLGQQELLLPASPSGSTTSSAHLLRLREGEHRVAPDGVAVGGGTTTTRRGSNVLTDMAIDTSSTPIAIENNAATSPRQATSPASSRLTDSSTSPSNPKLRPRAWLRKAEKFGRFHEQEEEAYSYWADMMAHIGAGGVSPSATGVVQHHGGTSRRNSAVLSKTNSTQSREQRREREQRKLIVIVDFEANCIPNPSRDGAEWADPKYQIPDFVNEVIEFPTVILRNTKYLKEEEVEDERQGCSSTAPGGRLQREELALLKYRDDEEITPASGGGGSSLVGGGGEEDTTRDATPTTTVDVPAAARKISATPANVAQKTSCWEMTDEFCAFVRPVRFPVLTPFCKHLTSITQEQVDQAETFPTIWNRWQDFMSQYASDNILFVTCGDWDFRQCLPKQLAVADDSKRSNTFWGRHTPIRRWCNLKQVFTALTGEVVTKDIPQMLAFFGLSFDGWEHRGIDDCRNIARVCQEIIKRYGIEALQQTSTGRYYYNYFPGNQGGWGGGASSGGGNSYSGGSTSWGDHHQKGSGSSGGGYFYPPSRGAGGAGGYNYQNNGGWAGGAASSWSSCAGPQHQSWTASTVKNSDYWHFYTACGDSSYKSRWENLPWADSWYSSDHSRFDRYSDFCRDANYAANYYHGGGGTGTPSARVGAGGPPHQSRQLGQTNSYPGHTSYPGQMSVSTSSTSQPHPLQQYQSLAPTQNNVRMNNRAYTYRTTSSGTTGSWNYSGGQHNYHDDHAQNLIRKYDTSQTQSQHSSTNCTPNSTPNSRSRVSIHGGGAASTGTATAGNSTVGAGAVGGHLQQSASASPSLRQQNPSGGPQQQVLCKNRYNQNRVRADTFHHPTSCSNSRRKLNYNQVKINTAPGTGSSSSATSQEASPSVDDGAGGAAAAASTSSPSCLSKATATAQTRQTGAPPKGRRLTQHNSTPAAVPGTMLGAEIGGGSVGHQIGKPPRPPACW